MIEVMFADGTVITGATYRETEDAIRAAQWQPFPSRRAFRREMRRRALLWGGQTPKPVLVPQTSKAFLQSLAAVGLCRIDKN